MSNKRAAIAETFGEVYGFLHVGCESQYDGSDSASTKTIFVCQTKESYDALARKGAIPEAPEIALKQWNEEPIENMVQFEFHK